MASPTSKQLDRASGIRTAAEQSRAGLQAMQGIALNMQLDGVVLTGADLSATSLAYTDGASLDLAVAAIAQLLTIISTTDVTGSSVKIAQAIAAVCGS
jgi:2-keto-3-deoxy-L-rhamnonate aldolase RhmA